MYIDLLVIIIGLILVFLQDILQEKTTNLTDRFIQTDKQLTIKI